MNPTVQAALITGIVTLAVCLINNYFMSRKQKADLETREHKRREEEVVRDAKLELKLSSIEKKLDEHNGYAEKIGSIQTDIAFFEGNCLA